MANPKSWVDPELLRHIAEEVERAGRQILGLKPEEMERLKAMNRILLGGEKGREYYGGEGSLLGRIRDAMRAGSAAAASRSAAEIEKAEMQSLERLAEEGQFEVIADRLRFQYAEAELKRVIELAETLPPVALPQTQQSVFSRSLPRMWAKLREQTKMRPRFTDAEWATMESALQTYSKSHPTSTFARLSEEQQKARVEQDALMAKIRSLPRGPEKDRAQFSWLSRELTEMQPRWDREMASMSHIADPATRDEKLAIELGKKWSGREKLAAPPEAPAPAPAPAKGAFRFAPSSRTVRPAEAPQGPEYAPPQGIPVPRATPRPVPVAPPQGKEFFIQQMRANWSELTDAEKAAISHVMAGVALTKAEMKSVSLSAVNFVVKYMKDHGLTFEEVSGIETLAPRRATPVELQY